MLAHGFNYDDQSRSFEDLRAVMGVNVGEAVGDIVVGARVCGFGVGGTTGVTVGEVVIRVGVGVGTPVGVGVGKPVGVDVGKPVGELVALEGERVGGGGFVVWNVVGAEVTGVGVGGDIVAGATVGAIDVGASVGAKETGCCVGEVVGSFVAADVGFVDEAVGDPVGDAVDTGVREGVTDGDSEGLRGGCVGFKASYIPSSTSVQNVCV